MSLSPNDFYRFDEFELDPRKRTLLRGKEPIALSPKAFEVLHHLVRNPGRVVSKEELLQAVWPESFVEEGNLAQHISGLRKAFADRASYIATIPGRGYQFTADVTEEVHGPSSPGIAPNSMPGGVIVQTVRQRSRVVIEDASADSTPALPAPRPGGWQWPVALLTLAVLAAAAWVVWARLHRPTPGDHHQLVLADFDNRSGEEPFDFVLKNALEIDIEQSPLFTLLSNEQTHRTLQQMALTPGTRLTPAIAREVCERNAAQAVLGGSIVKLGGGYVIMLDATDCVSGKPLAKFEAQARSQDDTLRALGNIAARMRRQLGESLRSIQGFDVPVEQSTTASFDALVAYSRGLRQPYDEAIPYLERAIQLDPNFAMAYEQLGVIYGNLSDAPEARKAFAHAYDLRQPTSPREQFIITSRYDEIVQDDLDLAAKNYELWTRSYPLDRWVWGTLANTYTQMGRYPEAIAAGERGLSVDPNYGFSYAVLARAYKRASQFDRAKAVCREAEARKLDGWGVHSVLFQIAVSERDQAAMVREAAWDNDQDSENQTLDNDAFAAATMGRLQQAHQLFQQAQDIAVPHNIPDYALDIDADKAEAERLLGDFADAREHAGQVPVDRDEISFQAAINAALSGDAAYARRVVAEEKKAPATSTLVRNVRIPLLNAAIALHEGRPGQVVPLLRQAKVYELRDYYVPSLLGQAFLELDRPAEAIAEYREVLANPGIDPLSPMYPLAHLGLARAYALQHGMAQSRSEYEQFFALWKDADPAPPILNTARKEYSHLPGLQE